MYWTPFPFGKHKGKTLPQIVFEDPGYFFWLVENAILYGRIADEAEEIYRKATNIKIPENEDGELEARYFFDSPSDKFRAILIGPSDIFANRESPQMLKYDRIDLSIPHEHAQYDKKGNKQLIRFVKAQVLGCKRVTKQMVEEFFEDEDNFLDE